MGNAVLDTEDTYITWAHQASHRLARAGPFFPHSWAPQLTTHFCNLASLAYKNAIRNVPPSLHFNRIVAVKRAINRHFVILPLDKNAGKPALMCRRLYARTLLDQYGDTTQFATIADCHTPADARSYATQHIYQRAVSHGVAQHYRFGRRFAPPSSFVSMKKESTESQGTLSMRILFSYYKHATKSFAKKVGRCLNLLISAGTKHLCTMEMQHMDDIIPWVIHVNSLGTTAPTGTPQTQICQVF